MDNLARLSDNVKVQKGQMVRVSGRACTLHVRPCLMTSATVLERTEKQWATSVEGPLLLQTHWRALPFCSLTVTLWGLKELGFNKKRLATLPCFCTVSCSRISTFASIMMAFFCHRLDLVSSTHGLVLIPLALLYGWVSHLTSPCDAHLPVSWMQMLLHSMAEPMARLQPAVWLLP